MPYRFLLYTRRDVIHAFCFAVRFGTVSPSFVFRRRKAPSSGSAFPDMERKLENDYWLQRPDSNRRPRGYGPRELPLLHSAVCPFRGIPSMQYARLKAYPSSRTVERTIGNEPTRHPTGWLGIMLCAYCPDIPPGTGVDSVNSLLRDHPSSSLPASCSVWDMSPPRCCRTGKK